MTNECKLSTWTKNSRIDHAVSTVGPEGPYTFADVAVNTWAHNAAPIKLHDGSYAIIHIGTGAGGPNGGQNCTPGAFSSGLDTEQQIGLHTRHEADGITAAGSVQGGSTIHVSKSLYGPWEPLANSLGGCNNPAPWVTTQCLDDVLFPANGVIACAIHNGTCMVGRCCRTAQSSWDAEGHSSERRI